MIAAIYARKSTEQLVADDQKSVARQIENARAFAVSKGWAVVDAYVFSDDGVSGAETTKLLGKQRLLSMIRSGHAPFKVLVMQSNDRLSRRDGDEAFGELKSIARAGVDVWFYADGQPFQYGDFASNTLGFLRGEFAAEWRRAIASKTREAMERKAERGHVTGGRVFGYDNLEIRGPSGERSHVERRVNEAEAAVVRRIFELAAAGAGQARIAKQLNAERACAPLSQRGRPHGWATSSVHAVLFRPLYRGEIVWNRTKKRNSEGEIRVSDRPEREWKRIPAPGLRVVPEELWRAAHARIGEAREAYRVATKGLRGGRPRVESRYLLPGLARCAVCGGGLMVRTGGHGTGDKRRRVFAYSCSGYHNRGADVCSNNVHVPMTTVDASVLESLGEILTPDLVDDILGRLRELVDSNEPDAQVDQIRQALAAAESQVEKYAAAIGQASNIPAVVRLLQEAEQRRQALAGDLARLEAGVTPVRIDWRLVEAQARARVIEWRGLLRRHTLNARTVLRALLVEPLRFTPFREFGRRGFRFEGLASMTGLVEGVVAVAGCRCPS